MQRLSVTLSAEQRRYLRDAVASGRFASESEVLRDLIRRQQQAEANRSLTAALAAGLTGEEVELTPREMAGIWREARSKVRKGRVKR